MGAIYPVDPDRDGVHSWDDIWRAAEERWAWNDDKEAGELAHTLQRLEHDWCERRAEERLVGILLRRLWGRFEAKEIDARQMLVEAFSYGRAFEHLDDDEEEDSG